MYKSEQEILLDNLTVIRKECFEKIEKYLKTLPCDTNWDNNIVLKYVWVIQWPNQSISDAIRAGMYRPDELLHPYLHEMNICNVLDNNEKKKKVLMSASYGDWISLSFYQDLIDDRSKDMSSVCNYDLIQKENMVISEHQHIALANAVLADRIGLDPLKFFEKVPGCIFRYLRYFRSEPSEAEKGLQQFKNSKQYSTISYLCDGQLAQVELALLQTDALKRFKALDKLDFGEAWFHKAITSKRLKNPKISWDKCMKHAALELCYRPAIRFLAYHYKFKGNYEEANKYKALLKEI